MSNDSGELAEQIRESVGELRLIARMGILGTKKIHGIERTRTIWFVSVVDAWLRPKLDTMPRRIKNEGQTMIARTAVGVGIVLLAKGIMA